ncbi:hypothetical protein [Meiothermus sp.]|uniref:hypothetical protein n=1 Tax=Meiothermus sp. TaxID=1955249 RepID=UPI0021DC4CE3|nr:hypothetical protein [Meiothermus sp.]GIW34046.1 MAG: hypothetical protein KatS3mg072_1379 [Meiothermus sp.]
MSEPIPKEVCFELRIRPESAAYSWHATLKLLALQPGLPQGELERYEFDSPLELARHLASLENPKPKGKLR